MSPQAGLAGALPGPSASGARLTGDQGSGILRSMVEAARLLRRELSGKP